MPYPSTFHAFKAEPVKVTLTHAMILAISLTVMLAEDAAMLAFMFS